MSRKAQHSLRTIVVTQFNLLTELQQLSNQLVSHGQACVHFSALALQPSIVEEIQVNQESDPELQR